MQRFQFRTLALLRVTPENKARLCLVALRALVAALAMCTSAASASSRHPSCIRAFRWPRWKAFCTTAAAHGALWRYPTCEPPAGSFLHSDLPKLSLHASERRFPSFVFRVAARAPRSSNVVAQGMNPHCHMSERSTDLSTAIFCLPCVPRCSRCRSCSR